MMGFINHFRQSAAVLSFICGCVLSCPCATFFFYTFCTRVKKLKLKTEKHQDLDIQDPWKVSTISKKSSTSASTHSDTHSMDLFGANMLKKKKHKKVLFFFVPTVGTKFVHRSIDYADSNRVTLRDKNNIIKSIDEDHDDPVLMGKHVKNQESLGVPPPINASAQKIKTMVQMYWETPLYTPKNPHDQTNEEVPMETSKKTPFEMQGEFQRVLTFSRGHQSKISPMPEPMKTPVGTMNSEKQNDSLVKTIKQVPNIVMETQRETPKGYITDTPPPDTPPFFRKMTSNSKFNIPTPPTFSSKNSETMVIDVSHKTTNINKPLAMLVIEEEDIKFQKDTIH